MSVVVASSEFCICRFIPESPRWLLSQNKKSKAVEITEAMAKENKMTLSKNIEVAAGLTKTASVFDTLIFLLIVFMCYQHYSKCTFGSADSG